eukprot:3408354-Pleurochrysis_carterae.AAC.2
MHAPRRSMAASRCHADAPRRPWTLGRRAADLGGTLAGTGSALCAPRDPCDPAMRMPFKC